MTDATAETRLVLFAWLSVFGMRPVLDDRAWIASVLHVTLKHLKAAIDYLVEENYLLKKLSFIRPDMDEKAAKYSYVLRDECWDEWQEFLKKMHFSDIFKHVIEGSVNAGSSSSRKPKQLLSSERLILAMLVSQANSALHVVGFEHGAHSKMLGVSDTKLARIIRNLISNGYISTESYASTSQTKFGRAVIIYRIEAETPNRKRINIGLFRIDGVERIEFLTNLRRFYRMAVKQKKPNIYPVQLSSLPDKHYFELSKAFQASGLLSSMHYLCHSIAFSTASDHISVLAYKSKTEREYALIQQRDKLKETIRIGLSHAILNGKTDLPDIDLRDIENSETGSLAAMLLLTNYTIEKLSEELTLTVNTLIERLILLIEIYGMPFNVIRHQLNTVMMVLTETADNEDAKIQNKTESKVPASSVAVALDKPKVKSVADFVLTLLVPNRNDINDGLVDHVKFFTKKSGIEHASVQFVDEVVVKSFTKKH